MNFKKCYLISSYILLFVVSLSVITLVNGCKQKDAPPQPYKLTGNVIVDGRNLAQLKCTRCHALVPVNALSKDVWERHVLPYMASFMHISLYGSTYYKRNPADTTGATLQEWLTLVDYYKKAAPDTVLPAKKPIALSADWAGFTLKKPAPVNYDSFTTMVAVNPYTHKLYSADFTNSKLLGWDSNLKPDSLGTLPSPAVSVAFAKDTAGNNAGYFSCVGRLELADFPNGKVVKVNLDAKELNNDQTFVASDLPRPQQTVFADFNKDGLTDMVVCGQGKLKGGVFLLTQNRDHTYNQEPIYNKPGAVQAVAGDFNKDGWLDVMVLTGSGDEGLWQFLNDKKGGFTQRNLLHFPPVNGSSSFQLADMDHDGNTDLIYTCGYNYRDSRRLKPYHGLYIYTNSGNWNFKQRWFYPINGCTKAIAVDFDGDGDLDIATIAFFADMKNMPEEEFIYFEQNKPFDFKPHAIPVSQYGRWMCMDVADQNNDGKPDIILGNYSSGFMFIPDFKPSWNKKLPLIVLENHTGK
ncbi:VCBS repeat-containing protein [Mucilaginibacter sabulilitoris]|uniref:VCBS repeat-containing protein n=1 Tax=Mucilaginibacter sabulilitoris TaxID=1173583 RepID=A0ABZ0TNE1_9SPHI|nr:VCBS repeat-containing protein [Mucilaginibacter sabulilitoris]WPU93035.1 VCBS repeat-containing protein [Mucilaginibacter sabulilitoris]